MQVLHSIRVENYFPFSFLRFGRRNIYSAGEYENMKKFFSFSLKLSISLLLIILFLEVGLRIIPNIIPPKVLINFKPRLREKVAQGWLPTYGDTIILNRDDNGPPLRIWKPFIKYTSYDADVPGDVFAVEMDEIGFCNP